MNSAKCSIRADFLEHRGRKLFYLLLEPAGVEVRGSVLFLPPFAEEMHKSRHIVASQARAVAGLGYRVMLLDLTGCGDSGGEFVDASWQTWLQDAAFAAHTLGNLGAGSLTLWGLRMGALLACELSQDRVDIDKLVLWQPLLNGEQQIDQFLRLRTVASTIDNQFTLDRKTLWSELRAGRSLDIAGYELSAALAIEMAGIRLNDVTPGCPVHWVEIGYSSANRLSRASDNVVGHWREQGVQVDAECVKGEPFWRTVEARINQDLQGKTTGVLAPS